MPSKSVSQQHLFQAAEHGADFPMADKLRQTMSHDQLHDFSVGPEAGKPQHVAPPPQFTSPLLRGTSTDIVASNTGALRNQGQSEFDATRQAIASAAAQKPKPKSRHANLGKFLHPRKDGKTHGSE